MSKRLEMFDKLIENGSEDPFVYYGRAMDLKGLERPEGAMSAFAEIRERFPDYVPSYLIAAQLAERLGRRAEALTFLREGCAQATDQHNDQALGELSELRAQLEGAP